MELSKTKKPLTLILIFVLFVALLGIVAVLIWDLISKFNRGWTNRDTIQYVLIVLVLVAGAGTDKALFEFYVHRDNNLLILNNNIYRAFSQLKKANKIKDYREYLIAQENEKYLKKINKIFLKYGIEAEITKENIMDYFDSEGCVKDDYSVDRKTQFKLIELFKKATRHVSIKYEKIFQEYHSGLLLNHYKFPFFEIIIPLFIGVLGLLVSSYQVLLMDGSIKILFLIILNYLQSLSVFLFFGLGVLIDQGKKG